MRLSEEQVKQGILHSDPKVRFAALNYFANAFSRDATVMPVAIEAFRLFGRRDAFESVFPMTGLAQTPETIEWAIAELRQTGDQSEADTNSRFHLARLLMNGDPELVLAAQGEILEAFDFSGALKHEFKQRLKLHAMDDDACWRKIKAICEKDKGKRYVNETRYPNAKVYAATLARRGDRNADRMMALLAEKIEDDGHNPMKWMEPLMVYMAGEMRYEPATPLLVAKLHEDDDLLNDECLYALAKIGTDSVVCGLGQAFPSAEWAFRLFAAGVLGRIHSDVCVATCSELLRAEEDEEIRVHLGMALADQFSSEGNELARSVLLEWPEEDVGLKETLVASCTLLGQDFPELAELREGLARARREAQSRREQILNAASGEFDEDEFDEDDAGDFNRDYRYDEEPSQPQPVLHSHKGAGRNDPCPCGSGKKYKQCCLRKQAALE